MKIFSFFLIGFFAIKIYAYTLPNPHNADSRSFLAKENGDGTYNFYLKKWPEIFIYHSRKMNMDTYTINRACNDGHHILEAIFSYSEKTSGDGIIDSVLFNQTDKAVSNTYNISDNGFLCLAAHNIMADSDFNVGNPLEIVAIHPIFPNQPKIWMIIKRNGNAGSFPDGASDYPSRFLKNSDLFLAIDSDFLGTTGTNIDQPLTKSETIPINYSIFNQKVDHPTCYAIPEDHKLRPCTPEEAKLRTPGLKTFLGEKG